MGWVRPGEKAFEVSRKRSQTDEEVAGLRKVGEVTVRRRIGHQELRRMDGGTGWWTGSGNLDALLQEAHRTKRPKT